MSSSEVELVGAFDAQSDEGAIFRILILQEYHLYNGTEGKRRVAGHRHLRLEDGTHVNRVSEGNYQIIDGEDTLVMSTDPKAP